MGSQDTFHDTKFNLSTGCTSIAMIYSRGIFFGSRPLEYSLSLLLMQLSISSIFILFFSRLLKPFGLYSVVPHILGGIILGPSVMGRIGKLTENFFPTRSFIVLDTLAVFGCVFYFFLIGVKLDLWMWEKIRKQELFIGFATVGMGLLLSIPWSILVISNIDIDKAIASSLTLVATAGSMCSFPVVAHYLNEQRMLNSEFGRVALSTSLSTNLVGFVIITLLAYLNHEAEEKFVMPKTVLSGVGIVLTSLLIVRPAILWCLKKKPEGEALKEEFIYVILAGVLVVGFVSQATGNNIYFGPLLYGLAIPSGPPLGSAIVDKVELINSWLFMPLFFVKVGLITDLGSVSFKSYLVEQFTIFTAWTGKFIGAYVSSVYCGIPSRDAVSLGLTVNIQGVLELSFYKILREAQAIDEETFTVMTTSMVIITAIVTPILRYLCDPSRRYAVYNNRTVMHSDLKSELRVIVCAHDQDDVAANIKILEAINPTKTSPIAIYALHLVEHVGSAHPLLIPHKLTKTASSKASTSKSIVNALRYFEETYHGVVTVFPFTAISTYTNMHDEICTMALNKKVSLIIIPYHKKFTTALAFKKGIRRMNYDILNMAPCSVAVIVDRGILYNSRPTLGSWHSYSVAVLFLGGADDREALAVGTRMAGQTSINLTVIRLLEHGSSVASGVDPSERKSDNKLLCEFRLNNVDNDRIMYIEEIVQDGTGTAAALRSMENTQELIIVGRRHNKRSPLVLGLIGWNEETELGAIGDALASADFQGNASILVVQQHNYVRNERLQATGPPDSNMPEDVEDEAEHIPIHRGGPA